MTNILATTINPESLTLGDWIAIANAIEYTEGWAYHR